MVVGAFVRGLSMRDVESLCEEAGLGKLSKSTASRICAELRERFARFGRRDLYGVGLVALFLDAIFLNVRPKGPKEGVLCAWGFTESGERILVGVCLAMRESHEDWLSLARDLIARGLPAPMLVVADGAPGLIKAVEQCWPSSDRQHCSVHRARNLIAKLPEQERERVRRAYWQALDEATDERDATERLAALVSDSTPPTAYPPGGRTNAVRRESSLGLHVQLLGRALPGLTWPAGCWEGRIFAPLGRNPQTVRRTYMRRILRLPTHSVVVATAVLILAGAGAALAADPPTATTAASATSTAKRSAKKYSKSYAQTYARRFALAGPAGPPGPAGLQGLKGDKATRATRATRATSVPPTGSCSGTPPAPPSAPAPMTRPSPS